MIKMKKLLSLEQFLELRLSEENKIVFTNGCFDIIHTGHVEYLFKAKGLGDLLVIGLNSDFSVKKIKGNKRPINSQQDRAYILNALECVDYIIIFNEKTPANLILSIKPAIHVKGGDYKEEDLPEAGLVRSYGGEVIIIPYKKGYSTTELIEKIKKIF